MPRNKGPPKVGEAGENDPHIVTRSGRQRIVYFGPEKDGLINNFIRGYRIGKYYDVTTLEMFHFEGNRTYNALRRRYVNNVKRYGKDAIAHICPDLDVMLRFRTVQEFEEYLNDPPEQSDPWYEAFDGDRPLLEDWLKLTG